MFCFQKWFICSIRLDFQRKTGSTSDIRNMYGVPPEQRDPLQKITGRHVTVPYQFADFAQLDFLVFEISTCSQVMNIWFQLIYNFIQMDWLRDSIYVKLAGEPFLLTESYERLNLNCRMPDHGLEMLRLCV